MHALDRLFCGVLAIGLLMLAPGCSTEPPALISAPVDGEPRVNRIFAVGHGWHVGLVLPAAPLRAHLPELGSRFGNAAYLELGWGDKGFYQATEITAPLVVRAMLWSSGTVMHVVGIPASAEAPYDYFPRSEIVELCLSDRELSALNQFVAGSFVNDAGGGRRLVAMAGGIYGDSQFYDARGRYHLMNTCNKWVAKGLSSAGLSIDPTFRLTAASVLDWLKASGRATRFGGDGVIVAPTGSGASCVSR